MSFRKAYLIEGIKILSNQLSYVLYGLKFGAQMSTWKLSG